MQVAEGVTRSPTLCRLLAFVAAAVVSAAVVAAAREQHEEDNNPEIRIVAKTVKAHSINLHSAAVRPA